MIFIESESIFFSTDRRNQKKSIEKNAVVFLSSQGVSFGSIRKFINRIDITCSFCDLQKTITQKMLGPIFFFFSKEFGKKLNKIKFDLYPWIAIWLCEIVALLAALFVWWEIRRANLCWCCCCCIVYNGILVFLLIGPFHRHLDFPFSNFVFFFSCRHFFWFNFFSSSVLVWKSCCGRLQSHFIELLCRLNYDLDVAVC